MGKLIFVTGGVRSGKSNYALNLAKTYKNPAYIATALVQDEEMRRRVTLHQHERKGFTTYETSKDIAALIASSEHDVMLLDCVGNLVSNQMLALPDWENASTSQRAEVEAGIVSYMQEIAEASQKASCAVIIVSNEVGLSLVPMYALSRSFTDYVGRSNQILAAASDVAVFMVSGIPMYLKGKDVV